MYQINRNYRVDHKNFKCYLGDLRLTLDMSVMTLRGDDLRVTVSLLPQFS